MYIVKARECHFVSWNMEKMNYLVQLWFLVVSEVIAFQSYA